MSDEMDPEIDDPSHFSREQAWEIYGKHFLVGETYLDALGGVLERRQFHGKVIRVNPREGIVLQLPNGEERTLPPDFRGIKAADPGEYRLRSSGEVIVDPDYTCSYTITRPQ
jgi:hypothetical protein